MEQVGGRGRCIRWVVALVGSYCRLADSNGCLPEDLEPEGRQAAGEPQQGVVKALGMTTYSHTRSTGVGVHCVRL